MHQFVSAVLAIMYTCVTSFSDFVRYCLRPLCPVPILIDLLETVTQSVCLLRLAGNGHSVSLSSEECLAGGATGSRARVRLRKPSLWHFLKCCRICDLIFFLFSCFVSHNMNRSLFFSSFFLFSTTTRVSMYMYTFFLQFVFGVFADMFFSV